MLKRLYLSNNLLFLFCIILAKPESGLCQKHDYIWYYGFLNDNPLPEARDAKIDFNYNPPHVIPENRSTQLNLYCHVMSDSTGTEVLYYSNGLHVYNKENQIMENGEEINPGFFWELSYPETYNSQFSGLSVPFPNREDEFLYFHQIIDTSSYPIPGTYPKYVYFTHIDMTANEGLGSVVSKNNIVYPEVNSGFGLTKMGDNNGWWLVVSGLRSNIYHTYSVDSAGINLFHIDTLGSNFYENTSIQDQPSFGGFSPNGETFVKYDYWNGITVLDFNRCEGKLSNAKFYSVEKTNTFTSLAFSPNSRFIYFNNSRQLIQLDTWVIPEESPIDTIANWNGYFDRNSIPFIDAFAFSQLAPDGKIYMSATGSSIHLHVIERPNLPGAACGFRQHGFQLPTINAGTIPHFPNYRLEPVQCE